PEHVAGLARRHGVRRAVKSKSMVTEEIELNPALEQAGVDVVETDLGEWVQQLDGEPPGHILGPAMHKSRSDWVRVFRTAGYDGDGSLDSLAAFARATLRDHFLDADLGITGVNLAV